MSEKRPAAIDALKHYAHTLQLAAPREWEAFVEFFDAYATEITVAVTTAEQHEVLVAQGRARAFLYLLRAFRECHLKTPQPNPPSAAS